MKSISYAVPVCNELNELKNLTQYLLKYKSPLDEVVILVDETNHTQEVKDYVELFAEENMDANVIRAYHHLDKNFAKHKNYLNSLCSGDWIFQLDADEYPDEYLMQGIPYMIENNPEVEAYWVSRINTVSGLTSEHIEKWGWQVNREGWVNFPDRQMRLYKNSPNIEWQGKVHEQLIGYNKFGQMPSNPEYCIHHPKSIERQEKQNKFYDTI